ncbi:MAG: ubiquinone/menaquinone biosynthesis methyltransferase [Verrucomicrobiota bacterium]
MDYQNYDIVDGFDRIAPKYDRGNDAMTLGLHRSWRRKLCRTAAELTPQGGSLLDIATGTGDVVIGVLHQRPDIQATGTDPSEGMMEIGRRKIDEDPALKGLNVELKTGDCRSLPFEDNTFDTLTISWGIRNVLPYQDGLRDMHRVLKPGGHALVLESGTPEFAPMRAFYSLYKNALPWIGSRVTGYKPAYEYYKQSVDNFTSGRDFVAEMKEIGYSATKYTPLFGGVVYLYQGQK